MPDAITFVADPPRFERERFWNFKEIRWIVLALVCGAMFGSLDAKSIFAMSAAILMIFISFEQPHIGLSVLIATVPVQDAWPAQVGAFTSTWTRLALAILVCSWMVRFALGSERVQINGTIGTFAAFCGALALSILHARDIGSWAAELYRWSAALIVLVIAISILKRREDRRWILVGLAAGVLLSFGVALHQVATSSGPRTFQSHGLTRVSGLFGEPNPMAGYLEMATLPLLAVGLMGLQGRQADGKKGHIALLAIAFAGICALVLTQSRGGMLGFSAGCAVIAWLIFPRWGVRVVISGGLLACIAIWFPLAESVRSALGIDSLFRATPARITPQNWAAEERLAHWGAAVRMWASEPWVGIGAGNFSERFREFTPTWRFRISRGHAHSAYLQAAAQAGTIGLILFLAVLFAVMNQTIHCVRQRASLIVKGTDAGVLAVTVALAVHGIFDYLNVLSLSLVLSAIWAMSLTGEGDSVRKMVKHAGE